jgi:hypothetical protein
VLKTLDACAEALTYYWYFPCFRTVYHCPFCNLCRLGRGLGVDFFHCMTCNCCLGINVVNHKCLEKGLETNCPICCDFLFTSSATVRALPCGHYMHSACFQVSPLSCLCSAYIVYFLILYIFSFERNKRMVVESNLKPCFVLSGIHLQSLHLSNLQQIFRRYGSKTTFSPLIYCLVKSFHYAKQFTNPWRWC